MNERLTPIPPLLAVSALHQHLIRKGLRTKVSIIVESGEAREVHHFAALIGYGADAINPYLAYATYKQEIDEGRLDISYEEAVSKYGKSITEGVVKVMSKMGISTVQSYRGAQIFEGGRNQPRCDRPLFHRYCITARRHRFTNNCRRGTAPPPGSVSG